MGSIIATTYSCLDFKLFAWIWAPKKRNHLRTCWRQFLEVCMEWGCAVWWFGGCPSHSEKREPAIPLGHGSLCLSSYRPESLAGTSGCRAMLSDQVRAMVIHSGHADRKSCPGQSWGPCLSPASRQPLYTMNQSERRPRTGARGPFLLD